MDEPEPAAPPWQDVEDSRLPRRGLLRSRIEFHWTWFAIVILLAAALGLRRIPSARPDWPDTAVWATAIGTAILVGASLVLHEAAHAVVARAHGAKAVVLRFALASGAVTTDARQLGPKGVAATAIAGPIANAAVTVVLGGLALVLDPRAPTGGLLWGTPVIHSASDTNLVAQGFSLALADTATLNAVAGAINLLPIPPFDGGIAIDAVIWHYFGLMGASRAISRFVAAGLIGAAIWQFISGDVVSGALGAMIALLIDRLGQGGRHR
jgi:Zn-dependent protease